MAKIYQGTVSVFKNTKNEITVKADADGKFSMENVVELYKTIQELSKKLKLTARIYKPEASGTVPLLFSDKWGNPYLALLPESKAPSKATVTKLA